MIGALAEFGVFRLGGVLVGTHALVVLGNVLGVRWDAAAVRTEDADTAAARVLEVAVPPLTADVPKAIESLGMGFLPVPAFSPSAPSTSFEVRGRGLRVDLVTPAQGASDKPIPVPRFNTAAAPVRYLEYLLDEHQPAAVVDGGGILVNVPAPARFAVHKLLVAQGRPTAFQTKAAKDVAQAARVLDALEALRPGDVARAWREAAARGDRWRRALARGRTLLARRAPDVHARLAHALGRRRRRAVARAPTDSAHLPAAEGGSGRPGTYAPWRGWSPPGDGRSIGVHEGSGRMIIVYGTRCYGRADVIEGLGHVTSRFVHIMFVPLIPIGTIFLMDGDRGINLPFSFKAAVSGWLRAGAILTGLGMLAGAVANFGDGEIILGVACFVIAALAFGAFPLFGMLFGKCSPARRAEIMGMLGLSPHDLPGMGMPAPAGPAHAAAPAYGAPQPAPAAWSPPQPSGPPPPPGGFGAPAYGASPQPYGAPQYGGPPQNVAPPYGAPQPYGGPQPNMAPAPYGGPQPGAPQGYGAPPHAPQPYGAPQAPAPAPAFGPPGYGPPGYDPNRR